ncbi:DUF6221 family protein [Amycolatopsis suaedae]|uniref:Uncharacterized protein n=1 Tax=Amycolatopsis suaedae TaxID=2510978 RepID=A0A4Q7J454_9PSEU|nr:DUF6221 family protein [Amycolatopsis suaedae]RZQ60764.1 hypothetical protein EWH70_27020 [Amycolatopsis suaedae]
MSSLVRFLYARIDEDEAHADAGGSLTWPAHRIREECAAKRAVLAALERDRKEKAEEDGWEWLDAESAVGWLFGDSKEDEAKRLAREILSALAMPYAWHPEFRKEWVVKPKAKKRGFW